MSARDDDRVALDAAVKTRDGFFTTFFVSPYSKYLARFAARRGWTPNAVTAVAFAMGVVAAASFAVGSRFSLILGAVLLQVSFTLDCVDGQLARYSRTFSNVGAWLDSILDRIKEAIVYAGLAVASVRGFNDDVWVLAAAVLVVQTGRHMVDLSYLANERDRRAPSPAEVTDHAVPGTRRPGFLATLSRRAVEVNHTFEGRSFTRWGKRILVLPIGERFALISLTAALATPRTTFLALLAWGSVAAVYALAVRIAQTVAR